VYRECLDHACCLGLSAEQTKDKLPVVKTRAVVVVDFGHRFVLQVHNHQCRSCNKVITAHPFAANCAATTPTENCETWITLSALQFFQDVYLRNGLSADGKHC
jgi:hypothetical protein